MTLLVTRDERERSKEIALHPVVERRSHCHLIDGKAVCRANARNDLGLQLREFVHDPVWRLVACWHERSNCARSQPARGGNQLPDQPADEVAPVSRGRSNRTAAGSAKSVMQEREHGAGGEVEMLHAFSRRPSPRRRRLPPGLAGQEVVKLAQPLFNRLQVLNDCSQLAVHGAGF